MDFGGTVESKYVGVGKLIHYDGRIFNRMDFGNYLWGAAMARIGFNYLDVQAGSHLNAFLNGHRQNGGSVCWHGDDKAEQEAIFAGFHGTHRLADTEPWAQCQPR